MLKQIMMTSAGVALALNYVSPARAQLAPGAAQTQPAPAHRSAPPTGPSFVLQHNDLDEQNRPRPLRIEDAQRRYGPEGTQMLVRDDQNYCSILADMTAAEERIRVAEEELRQAEVSLAQAHSEEERRLAERRRNRARLNLLDILLGVASVGLGFVTGGLSTVAGLGYGGMVAANQGQSLIRMKNSDADARLWYRWMQNYAQQMRLYDGRLELYDMRMQLASYRGSFWDWSMNQYCNQHVRPYAAKNVNAGYDGGIDAIASPGRVLRWQQGSPDQGRADERRTYPTDILPPGYRR